MRKLYQFPMSAFSRRARLALLHKGLAFEALDGRAHPDHLAAARRASPLRTMPVLVESDGRALGDSTAISRYLDCAYPDAPPIWPTKVESAYAALDTATLVDTVLNPLVDLATRYYPLRGDAAWESVRVEMIGRVQAALDALADRADKRRGITMDPSGWGAEDMWLFTATTWLEALPLRAVHTPVAAQLMQLGWSLPPALTQWADTHRQRADVLTLEAYT